MSELVSRWSRRNILVAGGFGAILILTGVAGLVLRDPRALMSQAVPYDVFHIVFGALGLSVRKLIRLSPDEQFAAVANALAKIPNPAVKAATTMQLLGKSGTAF